MDFSKLSNEEFMNLYNQRQQPQTPDFSRMSDEEFMSMYNQRQQPQQDMPLPPLEPLSMKEWRQERKSQGQRATSKEYKDYRKSMEQPQQQPLRLEGGVQYIGTGDKPREIGGLEKFAYDALPIAGGIAGSIAGLPLGPAGIIGGGAGGAATGELWKRNLEALRGVRPIEENDAVKTLMGAGQAGVEDALWTGGFMGVGAAAKPVIKAAYPTINQLLTSTPVESTKRAIERMGENVDIFKGKYLPEKQFKEIGEQVREGINFIRRQAGQATQAEREALQSYKNVKIPVAEVNQRINQVLQENTIGNLSGFSQADTRILREAMNTIAERGDKLTPMDIHKVKTALNRATQFEGVTNSGDTAIKQVAKSLDDILAGLFPKYRIANRQYADIANMESKLRTKLKEFNAPRNIRNMYSEANQQAGITDILLELDAKLPAKYKFADVVADLQARGQFEHLFPFSRGGTRSEQEITNFLLRGGVFGGFGHATGGAGYALAPLLSPRVQAGIIRGAGKIDKPLTPAALGTMTGGVVNSFGDEDAGYLRFLENLGK